MFNQIYAIAVKELKILARDGGVLAVLFVMPVMFVLIMTFAGVGNQSTRESRILVVNQDEGEVAGRIIQRLQHEEGLVVEDQDDGHAIDQDKAEDLLLGSGSEYALALVFPRDFSERLQSGTVDKAAPNLVKFIADPAQGGQNLNPIERLIRIDVAGVAGAQGAARIAEQTVGDVLNSEAPDCAQGARVLEQFSRQMASVDAKVAPAVQFQRVAPRGLPITRPIKAEEQNVPGYTIFGIFFIVQVIGNTLLREKENGTFNRLRAAPISPSVLLFGKLVPFYLVNILQVISMFAFGRIAFGIGLGNSPAGLLAVSLATAAVANALGLLIAAISKTTEQMGPLSGLILVTLATVGGLFIPYFEMPRALQKLAFFTPHAWALKGFQDILVRGYDLHAVMSSVLVLLGFAAVLYALALARFRID